MKQLTYLIWNTITSIGENFAAYLFKKNILENVYFSSNNTK